MMNRSMQAVLVTAALALGTGCAGKTSKIELDGAELALARARDAKAQDCAKEIFEAAEATLAEAQLLANRGDHEAAAAKALEGEALAKQAEAASPPGCDQALAEVADPDGGIDPEEASRNLSILLEDLLKPVYFDFNESKIRAESRELLTSLASLMGENTSLALEIAGHCDSRGSTEYNLHLGERRAMAVKTYLVTQGVEDPRIQIISYGEERPAEVGSDDDAHRQNRRAELRTL